MKPSVGVSVTFFEGVVVALVVKSRHVDILFGVGSSTTLIGRPLFFGVTVVPDVGVVRG